MLGEVDNGITLPAEITPGLRIKFARVPCSTHSCRMLGDGVVIRLCQSGVCLNTRSSSSNPITGGGWGGGDLHVSESWKHLDIKEALCGIIRELGGFCTPPLTPSPWQA